MYLPNPLLEPPKSIKKSKMSEASTSGSKRGNRLWEGVMMDILVDVVSELTAAAYATLLCICKSWRAVFSSVPYSHHPDQLPFLLLPRPYSLVVPFIRYHFIFTLLDYPIGPIVRFPRRLDHRYTDPPIIPVGSLGDPKFYPLRSLSDTAGDICIGSSHGWLVLLRPDSRIYLRNPVTATTIPLPPMHFFVRHLVPIVDDNKINDLRSVMSIGPTDLAALIRFAVLSSDPSDDCSAFILVVVLKNEDSAYFFTCGPDDGYAVWKHHDSHEFPVYGFNDLTFHNGLCLATATQWYKDARPWVDGHLELKPSHFIAVFNFSANPAFQRLLRVEGVDSGNEHPKNYSTFLAASAAELLFVKRVGETTEARISIFNLPSIEENDQIVATPRPGLGDRALFLGKGNSVSVPAPNFPQYIRGNSIYFTDMYRKMVDDKAVHVGCVYVFDVEQGITTKAFEVVEQHEDTMWEILLPWWVTPNLQRKGPRIPRGQVRDGSRN